jgi:hypothetical protein
VIYFCCKEERRSAVRAYSPVAGLDINGIDYLEVVDQEEPVLAERQRLLRIFFVKPLAAPLLARLQAVTPANIRIAGGERTTGIVADKVVLKADGHLEVHVNERGDFSAYTLSLVEPNTDKPLDGLDLALSAVDFSFKIECPSPFDCRPEKLCPKPAESAPEIDYLAKDYASFRPLILDRMSLLAPNWRERNPADLGVTLAELLAYVGDYLSYRQDAIATEAYLGTAQHRTSVRRHARVLDYAMHDGCNARTWVQIRLKSNPGKGIPLPRLRVKDSSGNWIAAETEPTPGSAVAIRRTQFVTKVGDATLLSEVDFSRLVAQFAPEVFEPMHAMTLFYEHNQLPFYTWSDDNCCLPVGATKATLKGDFPNLKPGNVLVLKEDLGPKTGDPADANLRHRHPVRLTRVNGRVLKSDGTIDDKHGVNNLTDPVTGQAITEIEWGAGDALPFPLCVSSVTDAGQLTHDVSVALGNIVLADHGMTLLGPEPLGAVPKSNPVLAPVSAAGCGHCEDCEPKLTPPRFRPGLQKAPITQAATTARTQVVEGRRMRLGFDPGGPAAAALGLDIGSAMPAVWLGDDRGELWLAKPDLLSSNSFAPEFVVEVENDGRATIRFGDDESGMRPGEGTTFFAVYRVGNGTRGNIGAEALAHLTDGTLLTDAQWIESVSNPISAHGGVDPETLEQVRQYAPAAFRIQKRAVTPEDYVAMAQKHSQVQRAAATLRWAASWHTVFLTVDRVGGRPVDDAFEDELRQHLEPYRMAGHDLEIDGPHYVPLELEMLVCVMPNYFRSDVLANVRTVFGSGTRADGSRGFFHPDNFSFGQGVYLSQLYAAAQKIAGVRHVDIIKLQRISSPGQAALDEGVLTIGRLEIARLDNDPNFPDRGILTFTMRGGR